MPRNGSGTYSLPQPAFVPNTTISSSAMNSDLSDIASALTQSISSDGQTSLTGSLQGFAGSAAAPSYAFTGNATTGMYPAAGGSIGFSVSSTGVAVIAAAGFTSKSLGIIPGAGFGSTVTQTGSISTAVTINTICGQLITVNFAFTQGTIVSFTVNNSLVGLNDIVLLNQSVVGAPIACLTSNVGAGSFQVNIDPLTTATGVAQINFLVIKSTIT